MKMNKKMKYLLLIIIVIGLFYSLIVSSQSINVKDYIKDKFPSIFSFYLSSLEDLDSYEKEFIDLLQKLPKDKQEYYAKEIYKNGFSLELLEKLRNSEKIEESTLDWDIIKEKFEGTKEKDEKSTSITEEKQIESLPLIIKRIEHSTVIIFTYNDKGEFLKLGSGFFISQNGDVITNYHVIQGADFAEIKTSDGKTYPITYVLAKDERNDIICLSVDIPSKYAHPLSLSEIIPEVGERIIVYGSPLGLENTVSDGIISAIRDIPELGKIIQITAPVSPGSSGSPVLNMNGEVIGVATFQMIEGQNLNFAIPSQRIANLNLAKEKKISLSEEKEIGKYLPKYEPKKILSANITITDWEQESYGLLLGRSDYVDVYYAVENTGEVDIDYYIIYFTVTCKKGKEFYEWTNGTFVRTGRKISGSTMIDVAGNKVLSVEITDWELTSY
jgi:S1-C subfamily serine protease